MNGGDRPEWPSTDACQPDGVASSPSGLMDLLGVAAVLLEADGRIDMWSPDAEKLFGYTADEAVGQYAARLLLPPEHRDLVIGLFAGVLETGRSWAGAFPVRRKDGSTRLVEFRNVRLLDSVGDFYLLGLATDQTTLREAEQELALSTRLISQSPIGLAVLDSDLQYVAVNPALERMHRIPVEHHLGRRPRDVLPLVGFGDLETQMRQVLESGVPLIDHYTVGRTSADPGEDHAWSMSFYRLEDHRGRVLGVANVVLDVTDRHRATADADRARRRLALIADGSARIGTTLEVERTAQELADVVVPELADMAAVDGLDSLLRKGRAETGDAPALFRSLAVKTAYPTDAVRAIVPPGQITAYHPDHPATHCIRTRRPQLIAHLDAEGLARITANPEDAALFAQAGVHTDMAVPLIARGRTIGVLGLARARNPAPFDEDDVALAGELASRAAVCIDNARLHQSIRGAAEALQRSLLPQLQPWHPGLAVAARYRPAQAFTEVGGDWYDVIPLDDDKTALVVGDVMGSGIAAAAAMGRLRTATSTLADLDLSPSRLLCHLDKITQGMEPYYATCIYAVYDARRAQCRIASAGHLPPVLVHAGGAPELLDLPTGAPLGVGGVPFETATIHLDPGDRLVLYTDGLVETRHQAIDERLDALLHLLETPDHSLEETCDRLLRRLRGPGVPDDVALLIARIEPHHESGPAESGAEPPASGRCPGD
ncbi:SpoIIE family protein phosphatase [Peterkaempfera sp. SMS 1(5)a]|uniref:SpoIIE family protein phosphatase n=1 Tax=Peterkaempfera podocarpi TaxID=3232308 RepID=UPI00366C6850